MPMQIVIANDERESVFAEIYDGDRQWAEVSFDERTGALRLRVWGGEGPDGTSVDLEEALAALHEVQRRLRGRWMGDLKWAESRPLDEGPMEPEPNSGRGE